jgi:hypothetical protein
LASLPEEENVQQSRFLLSPFLKKGANVIELTAAPQQDAEGKPKESHLLNMALLRSADEAAGQNVPLWDLERIQNAVEPEPNSRTTIRLAGEDAFRLAARGTAKGCNLLLNADAATANLAPAEDAVSVLRIEWSASDAALTTLPWIGAAPELQDADKTAIGTAAVAVRDALAAKDFAKFVMLLDGKFARTAEATGAAKQGVVADNVAILTQAMAEADFAIQPLDAAQLQFKGFPGLNLVRVLKDNGPPIRGQGTEIVFSLDLYFSKLNGQWVIVE